MEPGAEAPQFDPTTDPFYKFVEDNATKGSLREQFDNYFVVGAFRAQKTRELPPPEFPN